MSATTPTFFIADKLRGIPLVTAASSNANNRRQQQEKLVQVEKRDADDRYQGNNRLVTQPGDSGLLFNPSAMTASTANLVRSKMPKTTTTTRRPPTTTTYKPRTTTRKWKTTTTSRPTTKRPKQVAGRQDGRGGKLAQLIGRQVDGNQQKPTSPTPISTLSMSRAQQPMAITEPPPPPQSQVDYEPTATTTILSSTEVPPTSAAQLNSIPQTSLTKSTQQTLTTLPLNQRRTSQTVPTFPRFTNRPSDSMRSAGENWVLFNRPDGSFSVFEILVLLSNIMIVSTIILVIILGWVKAIRKRRATTKRSTTAEQQQQPIASSSSNPNNNPDMLSNLSRSPTNQPMNDAVSDRASKISMISSGVSGLTSATASDSYQTQQQQQHTTSSGTGVTNANTANSLTELLDKTNSAIVSKMDEAKGLVSAVEQQVVGSVKNIQSEFKTSGMNLANKAMAIVQPTENSNLQGQTSSSNDADKLANAIKEEVLGSNGQQKPPISRSVSDLSGSSKLPKAKEELDNLKSSVKREGVALLEDLFNGSVPNLSTAEPAKEAVDQTKSPKAADATKASSNSLDSIELPGELVETIKKSGPRVPDHTEGPSPNLLLGQTVEPRKQQPPAVATSSGTSGPAKAQESEPVAKEKPKMTTNPKPPDVVATKSNPTAPKTPATSAPTKQANEQSDRPPNPMSKQIENKKATNPTARVDPVAATSGGQVKNHQVVVNRLDKRKTNLEIVDLRDESVTGKIKIDAAGNRTPTGEASQWISMDGLAVVQPVNSSQQQVVAQQQQPPTPGTSGQQPPAMSPSEIMESRFNVDYSGKRKVTSKTNPSAATQQDSVDSKAEEYMLNNIENELELDNKMKNRKYFVYVVHDGHFTAKKECIARIELPPKRRITLAELRGLIANSQDISLSSLRKNKFKFVTETYRLLNENEDAAVLHQVYPTQGVFLKLNIPEQEGQAYAFKGGARSRLSSGSGAPSAGPSSLSQGTIASRRRANVNRTGQPRGSQLMGDGSLPAIEVEQAAARSSGYGQTRASSVGRSRAGGGGGSSSGGTRRNQPASSYGRSKSSVQTGRRGKQQADFANEMMGMADRLPALALEDGAMPDELVYRRKSYTGMPLADMSNDKMRIITPSKYCSRPSCGRLANIRCGVCNQAHYCSVQCRIHDWPQHKQFCKKPRWRNSGQ